MRRPEQIVRAFWHDVWTLGKSELINDLFHAHAKENGELMDLNAFIRAVDRLRTAFPDFTVTIEDVFEVGPDRVVSRVTYSGTQAKAWFGLPARSGEFKTIGIDIFTIENAKITGLWHSTDHLDLVLQLGGKVVPSEEE